MSKNIKNQITKGKQIKAGNYTISIGSFDVTDVALISNYTGKFVKFKDIPKRNSKLKRIKNHPKLKLWLCSNNDLVWQWLSDSQVQLIFNILKTK